MRARSLRIAEIISGVTRRAWEATIMTPSFRHCPRKRAIQYSPRHPWLLDAPLSRGMTSQELRLDASLPFLPRPRHQGAQPGRLHGQAVDRDAERPRRVVDAARVRGRRPHVSGLALDFLAEH